MKKIISFIITICLIFGCLMISNISSYANDSIVIKTKVYIDKGENLTSGYPTFIRDGICNGREIKAGDQIQSRDLASITSTNTSIATVERYGDNFIIHGISSGQANINITVRVTENNIEYQYVYQYVTRVISAFDNVTFTYNYDKVTVNFGSVPEEITPVFSKDGQNWSESATITRTVNDSNKIYKAYKINNVITGTLKVLEYNKVVNTNKNTINKDVNVKVGDTYSLKNDIAEEYSYFLINGRNNITFNKTDLSFKANETGNTKLTIGTKTISEFLQNGTIQQSYSEYNYNIKVKAKPSDESSDPSGGEQGSQEDGNNTQGENSNNPPNDKSSNSNNNSNGSSNSSSGNNSSSNNSSSNSNVKGTWKKDSKGWWFEYTNGTYPVWDWIYTDNNWYFFDRSGYMASSEYRFGCWLNADGSWNTAYSDGKWKSDANGWWYEDHNWYPTNTWLKIDGSWYYFKSNGYMACNEYIDGYWLGADGAWR